MSLICIAAAPDARAQGAVDCGAAQSAMRAIAGRVMTELNAETSGLQIKGGKIKDFRIESLRTIETRGCEVKFIFKAVLDRRIRKDAKGTLVLYSEISRLSDSEICMRKRTAHVELKNATIGRENKIQNRINSDPNYLIPFFSCYAR